MDQEQRGAPSGAGPVTAGARGIRRTARHRLADSHSAGEDHFARLRARFGPHLSAGDADVPIGARKASSRGSIFHPRALVTRTRQCLRGGPPA